LPRAELLKNGSFNALVGKVKEILEEDLTLMEVDGLGNTSGIHADRPYIYGHPKLKVRILLRIVLVGGAVSLNSFPCSIV
jgi:hypothetical protein